jgi:hypothetical protein
MTEIERAEGEFARAFEATFARLQVCLEEACASERDWSLKVAAAIAAGLGFAAAEPEAAQLLTNGALAQGVDGVDRHERLIAHLSEGLAPGREERPEGERLPDITERAMAGGVVMLVAERVDRGREKELPAIVSEAIQFVLTPFLGAEEARRLGIQFNPSGPG